MSSKREISHEDFISACCTVATILAGGWWNQARTTGRALKRPLAPSAAMDVQTAAKYCGFGRTRFRELVTEGVFPKPVTIEGRKRWLMKDLDATLLRLGRPQRKGEK